MIVGNLLTGWNSQDTETERGRRRAGGRIRGDAVAADVGQDPDSAG